MIGEVSIYFHCNRGVQHKNESRNLNCQKRILLLIRDVPRGNNNFAKFPQSFLCQINLQQITMPSHCPLSD
jgi:hypothetical protein